MKLWHSENARSFRALWALEELGLDYELKMLSFPPRAYHKDYKAENTLGTVPLLVDGDTRMTESCAIIHYLAMMSNRTPRYCSAYATDAKSRE